jgi:hydrogenase-4 component B
MLALPVVCWLIAGLVPLAAVGGGSRPWAERTGWTVCSVGSVAAVVAGGLALSGRAQTLGLGDLGTGLGPAVLRLDQLGGLFAVVTFAVAAASCLASAATPHGRSPRLPAAVALALGSVLVVISADGLFVLLFGWESLTLAFFLLAGFDRHFPEAGRAAVIASTFGKASGAALLLGGLLAAVSGGGFSYAQMAAHPSSAALPLLLLGFGIKVGLVPVHVWLPTTYAAAPAGARAVMAGATVNVGFYGMWRALSLLGPAPVWLAVVALVVTGVTALLGIAHAAVHPDVRGLVAWSSVENAGVIGAGFAMALAGSAAGDQRLIAAGLVAGTAQVIAHSLGKSLLFVAVGSAQRIRGHTDLEQLRGLTGDAPWSGGGLVLGAVTLAGLPLTAGFASEWLTLESLMQGFRTGHTGLQVASAFAGALVALTIGVAGVAFVRLVALTAFSSGSRYRSRAHESWSLRLAVLALALGCLGAAVLAPWEADLVVAGLQPLVASAQGVHAPDLALQPVYADFSSLSPTWLWVVLPLLSLVAGGVAFALSGSRMWRVRRVPAWASASPGAERGVGYTSFAYVNPLRKVLSNILMTRHQLEEVERAERTEATRLTSAGGPGADERGEAADSRVDLIYRVDVVEVVDRYFYQPAMAALRRAAVAVTRLQNGRLDAYMTYMLLVLLAALAVVTALS